MKMEKSATTLNFILLITGLLATVRSNAFIDGDIPHDPGYAFLGAALLFTCAMLGTRRK